MSLSIGCFICAFSPSVRPFAPNSLVNMVLPDALSAARLPFACASFSKPFPQSGVECGLHAQASPTLPACAFRRDGIWRPLDRWIVHFLGTLEALSPEKGLWLNYASLNAVAGLGDGYANQVPCWPCGLLVALTFALQPELRCRWSR